MLRITDARVSERRTPQANAIHKTFSTLDRRVNSDRRKLVRMKTEQAYTKLGLKLSLIGLVASLIFIASEVSK